MLVLDTPPSRNALDFLDAPGRLTGFFQGRAIRVFLRPAGLSGRILGRGTGVVFGILQRVTGVDLLRDLSVFFRSLGGMIDGFTERAARVGALLEDPATTFLIVTAPRHDPVEEAIFFHRKLREAGMPFGGLVINRVHQPPDEALPAAVAADLGPALAERVSVATGELAALAARDADERAAAARPARRPADDPRARARRRRPRRRGPRARALTPVRVTRAARRRRGAARVEVAAEHVAQHGAQAAAELVDERVDLVARAHEAGHRGALERDRLAHAGLEPRRGRAPRRRSPTSRSATPS